MNIGVVGSRRRNKNADRQIVYRAVHHLRQQIESGHWYKTVIVSGGCPKGGYKFAEEYADIHRVEAIIHRPDQSQRDWLVSVRHVPVRAACTLVNYARNELIARDSDILIACVAPDREGGTENTIKHFLKKLNLTEGQAIQQGKLILV